MDEGSDGLSACIFLVLGGQGEYRLGEPQHLLCSAPNQGLARPAQVWQSQEAAGVRVLGHKESLLWVD
jgi:hypothetical protein